MTQQVLDFVLVKDEKGLGFTVVDDAVGVYVHSVTVDGAAAGFLNKDDRILFVNNVDVREWKLRDIVNMFRGTPRGKVPITVARMVQSRSDASFLEPDASQELGAHQGTQAGETYLTQFATPLGTDIGLVLGGGAVFGGSVSPVVVKDIVVGSLAANDGTIQPEDSIVAINGHRVSGTSLQQVLHQLNLAQSDGRVSLVLQRAGVEARAGCQTNAPNISTLRGLHMSRLLVFRTSRSAQGAECELARDTKALCGFEQTILVRQVPVASDLWQAGLRPGQVILGLNEEVFTSPTRMDVERISAALQQATRLDILIAVPRNNQGALPGAEVVVRRNTTTESYGFSVTDRLATLRYVRGLFVESCDQELLGENTAELQSGSQIVAINNTSCIGVPYAECLQRLHASVGSIKLRVVSVLTDHDARGTGLSESILTQQLQEHHRLWQQQQQQQQLSQQQQQHHQNVRPVPQLPQMYSGQQQEPLVLDMMADSTQPQQRGTQAYFADADTPAVSSARLRGMFMPATPTQLRNSAVLAMRDSMKSGEDTDASFSSASTSYMSATTTNDESRPGSLKVLSSAVVHAVIHRDPFLGFGIVGGVEHGILVAKVAENGPAEGKLHVGDRILWANGKSFLDITHQAAVAALKDAPLQADLIALRSSTPYTYMCITLTKKDAGWGISIAGKPTTGVRQGIFVKGIQPGTAAAHEGTLQIGDRILAITSKIMLPPCTHEEAVLAFKSASSTIEVLIERRTTPLVQESSI
eukprot:m.17253 g.17253  ORF g.17253 m.17253 type:complete len:755 (+) comp7383_c0_seq1:153-2417(+)